MPVIYRVSKQILCEVLMRIALITGASSGLGREFVSLLDEQYELDEIWGIGRNEKALEEL